MYIIPNNQNIIISTLLLTVWVSIIKLISYNVLTVIFKIVNFIQERI